MLLFQIKKGFKPSAHYECIRGRKTERSSFSNKFKIFSLIHRYHQFVHDHQFCSTRLPRWRFCVLVTMLARTNKRKWSLKKWRNYAKLSAIAEDFYLTNLLNLLLVYIQGFPPLCQPFFPNKPHTQTFLTFQSKWAREEKLCLYNNPAFRDWTSTKFWIIVMQMSSLFIHITNFLRTSVMLLQNFYILLLP